MICKFIQKIKQKQTPFFRLLYLIGHKVRRFNFPTIKWIHLPLYYFRSTSINFFAAIKHYFWDVPLFKSRCKSSGKGLVLPNSIPLIIGNLELVIGENVKILRSTLGASAVYENPLLKVGDGTTIGYGTVMSISKEITIGSDCLLGPHCLIMDSDDHPVNPEKRLKKMSVSKDNVKPVKIGNNVWLGSRVTILKGVVLGDNTVVAANSVVGKKIPPNCLVAGHPARIIQRDIHFDE